MSMSKPAGFVEKHQKCTSLKVKIRVRIEFARKLLIKHVTSKKI